MARKRSSTNGRNIHRKVSADEPQGSENATGIESEMSEAPIPRIKPAVLFRNLDNSVERRTKAMRQKLRAHHRSQVKKAEADIEEAIHSDKLALAIYRRTQIRRLSDLVKKRMEIESEIVGRIQSLSEAYESASNELDNIFTSSTACTR